MTEGVAFADVVQRPVSTSVGPCALPILYRDASVLVAMFRVPVGAAGALLPAALEPWPVLGAAVAVYAGFEYRDSTVGVYNEVGLGLLARKKGSRPSLARYARDMAAQEEQGLWVTNMPVTTERALVAGREIWNYPKYVTGIETRFAADEARVSLAGELDVTAGRFLGPRTDMIPLVTMTAKDGRLLRTVVETRCRVTWRGIGRLHVRITGDGPTAHTARAVGLDRATAVAAFRTDALRASLPAGKDVGPA